MILYKQIQGDQLQNRVEKNIPTTWMSRWVTGRINGLFHLLINEGNIGVITYNPLILAFDPNLQRDIQVVFQSYLLEHRKSEPPNSQV